MTPTDARRWAHYQREMASIARVDERARKAPVPSVWREVLHREREELWRKALERLGL